MLTAFEIAAKMVFDSSELDEGLDKSESKLSKFGSVIAKGAKVAGAAVVAGVSAAASGAAAVTKQAIDAYGEFEQLEGGVAKMFGTGGKSLEQYAEYMGKTIDEVEEEYKRMGRAQDLVMQNAAKAYATTGMSANAYMETVTSFSGSLIQSLGGDTEEAARIADIALRDIGDNYNTFGGDLEAVMNAYKGFSRNNFAMLDNLKLGYQGTKDDMIRLINDSGILNEEITDISQVSFAQMIEAVHKVQEQMNIAGTTANEAQNTIQGSINMTKSAWENLLAGLANPDADLNTLIDNMVESIGYAVQNIIPAATTALGGIASLIEKVVPMLAEQLPTVIDQLLPPLITATMSLLTAFMGALPKILNIISTQLPPLIASLFSVIMDMLPDLLNTITSMIVQIVQFIADNASQIVPAIVTIIHTIVSTITDPGVLIPLIKACLQIVQAIAMGIAQASPEIASMIPEIIANLIVTLVEVFPDLVDTVIDLIGALGLSIVGAIGGLMGMSYDEVTENLMNFDEAFTEFGGNVIDALKHTWDAVSQGITTFFSNIGAGFARDFGNLYKTVTGWGDNVWNAIKGTFDNIINFVKGCIDDLIDMFDFDWSLPQIKLPHFKISGGEAPWGFAGQGTFPSVQIQWYKKAMNTPYMLDSATIFGAANGKYLGGGEAGSEMIYSHDKLMGDIAAVVAAQLDNINFTIPVYIGQSKIDQQVATANARNNTVSGGR